ncbi:MAG: glucose-1-phosphate adenylyltransferase [Clostridia bacterium]|jgi:glucose-1-phosphate adenylyltransferase|nr:glucose-1-phosphate adenylyltransferase [Clostridia bacterium]
MVSKDCVAMILAGGQGSRLGALTKNVAKPAVPFGGKYRIIDFPLSNCVHSGIDTVGVLTQYQPLELNTYIGNGNPWDLDRSRGGAYVLPPYQSASAGEWYKGTANAIYQNIGFLDRFNPENVLILSGDHIYKMHYGEMLKAHKEADAAVTIAVMPVPWDEASRFGIMNTDENGVILEFEEKPANPKSNLASMGVYIFKYEALKRYLIDDERDPESSNDFGKNIIPKMLADGEKMMSYQFEGYWKDVGTVQSLWEANMDLIYDEPKFDLSDREWIIYSRNYALMPHYVGENAKIIRSTVTEGCNIEGTVNHSVIFSGVAIGADAVVKDSVIMPGAEIGEGAIIEKSVIGANAIIGRGAKVGVSEESKDNPYASQYCTHGIVLVEGNAKVEPGADIPGGSMVQAVESDEY